MRNIPDEKLPNMHRTWVLKACMVENARNTLEQFTGCSCTETQSVTLAAAQFDSVEIRFSSCKNNRPQREDKVGVHTEKQQWLS